VSSETAPAPAAPGGTAVEPIKAIPVRHPGRWIATAVVLFFSAIFLFAVATSPNFHWDVVRQYFTIPSVLHGVVLTIELTIISMVIGVTLGIVLAVMRLSPVPIISGAAWVYIWFFRGTPVLVQLLVWYYIASLTGPHPVVGIPLTHIALVHLDMNAYITAFTASILGLGLNEAAYMAEIVRAGIISVGEGQTEAAQSLGMTRLKTMRLVILPQAMRVIVPPTGNETISMLKTSSLASVITLHELMGTVTIIFARNFQTIPLLLVASIWYLILTSILTVGQFYVERHFARGAYRTLPPTPIQKLRARFTRNVTATHAAPPAPPDIARSDHR
jgi:polar amino acid transport system permease protein